MDHSINGQDFSGVLSPFVFAYMSHGHMAMIAMCPGHGGVPRTSPEHLIPNDLMSLMSRVGSAQCGSVQC